jgi:hypothetical protein
MSDHARHYAFARGYLDACTDGVERNQYDPDEQSTMRQAYRDGYDAGIADYCAKAHPEEVNK